MQDKYIAMPRPVFEPDKKKPADKQILYAGTKTSGIVIKITKHGLEIEGYYKGMSEKSPIYANLKEPVEINWEAINKAKDQLTTAKKYKKINKDKPDNIELEVNEDYLNTLPIVTINSNRYYIDGTKRERRPLNNPKQVWRY